MARPRIPVPPTPPVVTRPVGTKSVEEDIKQTVTQRMKERLAVADGGQIPPELQKAIDAAAGAAAQRSLELGLTRDIDEAVSDVTRGSLIGRFDSRVGAARAGLDHIVANDDVQQIMRQRAQMLSQKKKALEDAGFTTEQAMEILLADIAARGH
jgi:hypothetical protein